MVNSDGLRDLAAGALMFLQLREQFLGVLLDVLILDRARSLLQLRDSRITVDGVVIIKAQQYRTQEQNRMDALERLAELIRSAGKSEKARRPTKPTLGSKKRRLEGKAKRGAIKAGRGKVDF